MQIQACFATWPVKGWSIHLTAHRAPGFVEDLGPGLRLEGMAAVERLAARTTCGMIRGERDAAYRTTALVPMLAVPRGQLSPKAEAHGRCKVVIVQGGER